MKGLTVSDVRDVKQVSNVLESTLTPKLMGYASYFADQLAKLCIQALPQNTKYFDPEYIRVCKIMGSNLHESHVLQGMVVGRKAEGSITRVTKPKIAIYGCPLDTQ
jgi:T-complex protein 1 subunit theta